MESSPFVGHQATWRGFYTPETLPERSNLFESHWSNQWLTTFSYWLDPPLQAMETRVDPARFFRISRGALISLNAVAEVHPLPGGAAEVALKSGVRLEVSRRRVRDLMTALERG